MRSPTDDVLFTTAGMHPLAPYLQGRAAPGRASGWPTCSGACAPPTSTRSATTRHLTVFEMLGNWSLGDYFKETSIPQSFGLLTGEFGIDPHSLYVTVFAGDERLPSDDEAPAIWAQTFADAGVDPKGGINPLGEDDNWWSNGAGRAVRSGHRDLRLRRRPAPTASAAVRRHPASTSRSGTTCS